MLIDVTQECIDKGERGSMGFCPIALAIGNLGIEHCWVGRHKVIFDYDTEAALPEIAMQFVRAFDEGEAAVQPIQFEIERVRR